MALQLRRGTNAERLAMTPVNGELIFVTDYELVTLSVTAIDAGTDTLTSVDHGLAVDQQIKFQDASLNGLVLNQVYFVKTVPSSDTFTLSLTSGGAAVNITGTFTIPLVFAVTPTDAAGTPLGTGAAALWIGDGATVGGIIAASLNLDDLLDVIITAPVEGNTFYYDATTGFWRNTAIITIDDVTNNVTLLGDLAVNGGDITTTVGAGGIANLYNSSAIGTINIGNSVVTEVNIGNPSSGRVFAKTPSFETQSNATVGGDLTVTGADIGTGADNVRLQVNRTVASGDPQNVFKRSLLIRAVSAGTPAVGYGPALGFVGQTTATSSGNFEEAGAIAVTATDLTSAAESFKMTFNLMNAGAQDQTVMELDSTGNLQIDNNLAVDGGGISTGAATGNIFNTNVTTLTIANAATTVSIGSGGGTTTVNNNLSVTNDLNVAGGNITTTQTTFNLLNATATTVNAFGAGTAVTIGATTGTTTIRNTNTVVTGDLAVNGGDITTTQTTGNLFNATATTVNIGNGATNQVNIGSSSGTVNIKSPSLIQNDLGGASTTFNLLNTITTDLNIGGAATTVDIGANSGTMTIGNPTVVGTQTTQNVFNTVATTVNAFGASTATAIGSTVSGTTTIGYDAVVNHDLTVTNDINVSRINIDGQATINTATLTTTATATVPLTIVATRNVMTALVNIIQGANVHCVNATVLRVDATTAMITTYGEMYNNISLASFTADVNAGDLRLLVTPTSATSTVFSVVRTSLT